MPMPEKELPSREKKLVLVVSVYAIGNLLWECWGFAFRLRKNPLYGYYPKGEIILTSQKKWGENLLPKMSFCREAHRVRKRGRMGAYFYNF
jgi:hypothetical protein